MKKKKLIISVIITCLIPLFLGFNQGSEKKLNGIKKHNDDNQPIDSLLELVWKFPVEKRNYYETPLVVGDVVFPGNSDYFAIDANTGKKLNFGTRQACKIFKESNLDSLLCQNSTKEFRITNIYTNEIVYSEHRRGPPNVPLYLVKDTFFIYISKGMGEIFVARNLKTKEMIWSSVYEREYKIYKDLIITGWGELYFIDKYTGKFAKIIDKSVCSNLLINNGFLYCIVKNQNNNFEIIAVNLDDFETEILYDIKGYFTQRILYHDDKLIFEDNDSLKCYSLSKKELIYSRYSIVFNDRSPMYIIRDYIFNFETGRDVESYLEIIDTDTGILKYAEWSRDDMKYPYLEECGEVMLYLADSLTSNGLIIGGTIEHIYAYRFRN